MKPLSYIRNRYRQLISNFKSYPLREDFQSGRALFFVTGRSKSGTTWMANLLNSHPALFCGTIENSAFHQDLEFYYLGSPLSMANISMQRYFDSRISDLLKNGLISLLLNRCKKLSAERFGDKTPRQDVGRILEVFPETQVIIMMRDFRDMCVSLAFHQARVVGTWRGCFESEERKSLDNHFLKHHLQNYEGHQDIKKYFSFSNRMPSQVCIVKYEDLIADTFIGLRNVLSFLGVDDSPVLVRNCVELNSFKRLTRGRDRGEENPDSFLRKGIVGDWRNYFSEENVNIFKKYSGNSLISAGYEKDDHWKL